MLLAKPHSRPSDELLYEQLVRETTELIGCGTLRAGDRIPSVRQVSQQRKVSVATVLQAYRVLENQRLIEARPQSGYFVQVKAWTPPAEPEISRPARRATQVNISEMTMRVIKATRDPRLVPLGTALPSPELLPTEALNRALAAAGRRERKSANHYEMPPGNTALRNQIARRGLDYGLALAPEQIVTTCGCMEALNLCLRAVAKPGDTIAIESPTYFGILQCIESLGFKALEIPTHPRDGVSLDALAMALESQPIKACLFVLNFSNPLGSCMPDENKQRLVAMLAERGIPLIEDDIYGDLAFAATRPRTAKSFDREGLVLLCDSFSKTLAPGYRVGWVAPGRFQAQIEHLKYVNTVATATLPQIAIADFLANGGYDHHLRKLRRLYAEKVQNFSQAISTHFPEGTRLTRPLGGYVLWVELPPAINSLELLDRALAAGISITPGPMFSAKSKFLNFIRINCGNPWTETIERALEQLGRMVHAMNR
jgi:DNA-binding transcriptional MocR family regulator